MFSLYGCEKSGLPEGRRYRKKDKVILWLTEEVVGGKVHSWQSVKTGEMVDVEINNLIRKGRTISHRIVIIFSTLAPEICIPFVVCEYNLGGEQEDHPRPIYLSVYSPYILLRISEALPAEDQINSNSCEMSLFKCYLFIYIYFPSFFLLSFPLT